MTEIGLEPVPDPPDTSPPNALSTSIGPRLTPKQIIFFYESGAWEEFVLEWLTLTRQSYQDIKRLAGPGDRGIDVAAFLSRDGLEGDWHCFQCKHYADPLKPSDLWPEIYKIFHAVLAQAFTLPSQYKIVAPKECGISLEKLLQSPTTLRSKFIEALDSAQQFKGYDEGELAAVRSFALGVDFAMFGSVSLTQIIEEHSCTQFHAARFGGGLPERPAADLPPASPEPAETRYLRALLDAYDSAYPGIRFTVDLATSDARTSRHFPRQREAFYSAESLRAFARDSVPRGTFEALQDELFDAIVEVHEAVHDNGLKRLSAVLQAAQGAQLTSNALLPVLNIRDRWGVCHQLANDARACWV